MEEGEEAEVHVINTCTVTSRADHKARSLIRAVARARPAEPVIVTGCSAQTEADALGALAPNVVVVPQSQKARLLEVPALIARAREAGEQGVEGLRVGLAAAGGPSDPFAMVAGDYSFHTRAFLKVQDGCDCRCAYCRVPLARGGSLSLALDEVVRRAADLEARGRREIVLTGVNVSSWRWEGQGLADLLVRLVQATRLVRFRITSLEPEAITARLVEALSNRRVCPHFHIPVQSGSDVVLARMRRRYRAARVLEGVRALRAVRGDPFIAADILAGFPGETEDDHAQTLDLVRSAGFAALHVFAFSPRPGTEAAAMHPAVPERIRARRAREITVLSRELASAYASRWVGREVQVILEGGRSRARTAQGTRGVSENYLKVAVRGIPEGGAVAGRIVRARLIESGPVMAAEFMDFQA